jgi:hypothetical protein
LKNHANSIMDKVKSISTKKAIVYWFKVEKSKEEEAEKWDIFTQMSQLVIHEGIFIILHNVKL